ncbi:DUF2637 domain-containing protein [Streptacidiphilus albus]|uniref:DUF2637 domain-containing protein n=1 Tax=Streptacidiphilus albus TaxID=105425 RepID=UPI00054B9AF3|nr:DUF2637 domain-containing protein [Streptacidiphilus albus]
MRLSDITLGWGITAIAVVLAVAGVATLLRSRGTAARDSTDSWERSEERRRKKEALYGSASYVLLFACASVAAALSFHGLVGFGEENLDLGGGWQYLVPFGLDGAAMFCSVLAVREASHGDAALGSRLLVWLFAAASAWFNWVHAPRGIDHNGAPQFFAGMSLSAAVLFDRALKQTRRAALREQGLVPRPLPQIRIVRWLRAPRETFAAWSLMLLENVRTLDEAVDEVRDEKRQRMIDRDRARRDSRHERAELRALSSGNRTWSKGREARRAELPAVPHPAQAAGVERESVPAAPAAKPAPAPEPVIARSYDRTFDLTAEDDTLTLPRLDSLEQKLKDLEQLYG